MTWAFTRRQKPLTWIVLGLYLLAGLPFIASSHYRIHRRSSTECAITRLGQRGSATIGRQPNRARYAASSHQKGSWALLAAPIPSPFLDRSGAQLVTFRERTQTFLASTGFGRSPPFSVI